MGNRWGNSGNNVRLIFWLQDHCRWWLQPWNEKTLTPWKESYDQPREHIQKQRHYFANKVRLVKAIVFPVVMYGWELDCEECWVPKNWCFWTMVLEKTLESPLDCKEIQTVHPKGNQSEYSLEGLMLKQKLQYLATWCEELTHWKRPWCWERLKVGG